MIVSLFRFIRFISQTIDGMRVFLQHHEIAGVLFRATFSPPTAPLLVQTLPSSSCSEKHVGFQRANCESNVASYNSITRRARENKKEEEEEGTRDERGAGGQGGWKRKPSTGFNYRSVVVRISFLLISSLYSIYPLPSFFLSFSLSLIFQSGKEN